MKNKNWHLWLAMICLQKLKRIEWRTGYSSLRYCQCIFLKFIASFLQRCCHMISMTYGIILWQMHKLEWLLPGTRLRQIARFQQVSLSQTHSGYYMGRPCHPITPPDASGRQAVHCQTHVTRPFFHNWVLTTDCDCPPNPTLEEMYDKEHKSS